MDDPSGLPYLSMPLPFCIGSHHYYDPQFPDICFLGKPYEVQVLSEPVTISPPGLGVSLQVPPGAVQHDGNEPVNVAVQACLSGSAFKYPEGCTPYSAVYHISADSSFKKKVELTLEHFAELKTEEQASEMTFFRAKSAEKSDQKEFQFVPVEGGDFVVNGRHCKLSTQEFGLLSAGTKTTTNIRKKICLFHIDNYISKILYILFTRKAVYCAMQLFKRT